MAAHVNVFRITDPATLDWLEVRALFDRAFADPKFGIDAEATRKHLQLKLGTGEGLFYIWVAQSAQHGLCGLILVATGTFPLSPHPYIAHLFVDEPAAREPLMHYGVSFVASLGYRSIAVVNMSGKSDAAYLRLFRKFGAGEVKGSVIVYEIGERYGNSIV